MQFVAYVVRAPLCQRMPIVIGGSSGRPVVSGCAWEPRVTQPETFVEGRREILRQASVALGGRPVTVWEVSSRAELEPQASSDPAPTHHTTKLDVDATLRRWNIAIVQGSRWVGCQGAADGFWVVAPVRTRPPAPPPEGRERRSRERLTLELAGLCLGLLDRREPTPGHPPAARSDPLNDITTLPGIIAHELSNPLTAARGALARSERFDAVRVVRSCCTLESRVLKEKKIPLEFDSTLDVVYLNGDPNALYDLLEPDPQRRRRERRPAGTHPRRADAAGERRSVERAGRGSGHPPPGPGPDLRARLHDQALRRRERHGAGRRAERGPQHVCGQCRGRFHGRYRHHRDRHASDSCAARRRFTV